MLIKKGKRGKPPILSIWECDICSKHFKIANNRATEAVRKKAKKMCGLKCKQVYNKTIVYKNVTDFMRKNPTAHGKLKKGSGVTTDGYVWIRVVGKTHNNQIKVHRYLMEAKLGRPLRADEIVHHKDGDKLNNALDNLEILTIEEHNKVHGHFKAEKRNDIWSDAELRDCVKLEYSDFCKVYNRTRDAYHQMKYKIRRSLKGVNLASKKT